MPFLPDLDMEFDPDGNKEQVAVIMKGQTYKEAGLRKSKFPNIEGPLYDKLCQLPRHKFRNDVRKMALNMAIAANDKNFKPTVEWLDNFMRRFCLSRKKTGFYSAKLMKVKGQAGRKLDASSQSPAPSPSQTVVSSLPNLLDEELTNTNLYNALGIQDPHLITSTSNNDTSEICEIKEVDPLGDIPCAFKDVSGDVAHEDILSSHGVVDGSKDLKNGPVSSLSLSDKEEEETSGGTDLKVQLSTVDKKQEMIIPNKESQNCEKDNKLTVENSKKKLKFTCNSDGGDDNESDDSIEELPAESYNSENVVIDLDDSESSFKDGDEVQEKKGEEDGEIQEDKKLESESASESSRESDSDSENEDESDKDDVKVIHENKILSSCNVSYLKGEKKYYKKNYASLQRRLEEKLSQCTACYMQLNHHEIAEVYTHPLLGVLVCKKCRKFYGKGNFKKDAEGYDEYCRWCANGGDLLLCDFCPNGFCKKCIKRNLGRAAETAAMKAKSWTCYVCNVKPLMEVRAVHRIIIETLKKKKNMKKKLPRKERNECILEERFVALTHQKKMQKFKSSVSGDLERGEKTKDENHFNSDKCIMGMKELLLVYAEQLEKIEERKQLKCGEEAENQANRRLIRLIEVMHENLDSFKEAIQLMQGKESDGALAENDKELCQERESKVDDCSVQKKYMKRRLETGCLDDDGDISVCPATKRTHLESTRNRKESDDEGHAEEPGYVSEVVTDAGTSNSTKHHRKKGDETSNSGSDCVDDDGASSKNPNGSNDDVSEVGNETEGAAVKQGHRDSTDKPESSGTLSLSSSKSNAEIGDGASSSQRDQDSSLHESPSLLDNLTQPNADNDNSNNANGKESDKSSNENDAEIVSEREQNEKGKKAKEQDRNKIDTCDASPFKSLNKRGLLSRSKKNKKTEKPCSMDEISDLEFTEEDGKQMVKTLTSSRRSEDYCKGEKSENEKAFESLLASGSDADEKEEEAKTTFLKVSRDKNKQESICDKGNVSKTNKPSPLRFKQDKTGQTQMHKSKLEREIERKNLLAKKSLLQSDSNSDRDSDPDTDSLRMKTKIRKKQHLGKRNYKPKPKSVKEALKKRQISSSIVKVEKLEEFILAKLEQEGVIRVSDHPQLSSGKGGLLNSDSDDELDVILKVKSVKLTSQNGTDDEEGKCESGDESSEEEEGNKKRKKETKLKDCDEKEKKEGLMDIVLDKEDEEEEEEEEEKEENEERNTFTTLNDKIKKALLMSSDEEGEENEEEGEEEEDEEGKEEKKKKEDLINEKTAQELDEKRREKYEKKKKKENENSNEQEEEDVTNVKKKGLCSFKFSSSEDEIDDEDSDNESPRKARMFVDSDSDFDVSKKKKSKKRKMGVFDSSSEDDRKDSDDYEISTDDGTDKKTKSKQRKRIKRPSSSSEEEEDVENNDLETPSKKRHRRIIRDEDLLQSTKDATQEEQERRERVLERQTKYNKIFEIDVEQEKKELEKVVLDFNEETKRELVTVHENLVVNLKPHQASGIRFMFDATIENLERLEKGERGGGCILAHCMGLGKTLQVIAFIHTMLTNKSSNQHISRVIVCCPVNTVYNWVAEFNSWLKGKMLPFDVIELISARDLWARAYRLDDWYKEGGICIIGYDMFRNLSNENNKRYKGKMKEIFQKCFVSPGPDIMICDEGHIIKNEKTAISVAINKIKTRRRIVLTGTPLQNNLKEYHCMIQFVKPNLLGSRKEFMNRFVHPIEAGQCMDALPRDVRRMKRRAHILHNLLEGCVQRFDYSVLKPFLPPKFEYVVSVQMSEVQCKLYSYYLENLAQGGPKRTGSGLFVDFNNLSRIWSHPVVLFLAFRRKEMQGEEEDGETDLDGFINDDSDSGTSSSEEQRSKKKKKKKKYEDDDDYKEKKEEEKAKEQDQEDKEQEDQESRGLTSSGKVRVDWWRRVMQDMSEGDYDEDDFLNRVEISGKLYILLDILRECGSIGDKVLVFSQSILALDMIEEFLRMLDAGEITFPPEDKERGEDKEREDPLSPEFKHWKPDRDYLRMDGSISADIRKHQCKHFNSPVSERCRLFLISTRAGGVGINLVAANRVVIFDSSWNPSHDTQSIFRVYRFGQKKPCYIYRFVAQGTMEEKIYSRQVTKLSTALRVVDEHQIKRYFNMGELSELYQFTPATFEDRETPSVPEDRLLAELLIRNRKWIVKYHEQDSLLENQTGEELTEEERKAAWEDYENEKKGYVHPRNQGGTMNLGQAGHFPTSVPPFDVQQIIQSIYSNNPSITPIQLQENLLLATQQVQKVHLSQYQKIQGFLYNLKNPMIAPEILRQLPVTNHADILQNLEQQLKTLEENIQTENKVIEQISRLKHSSVSHNSMMAAGLARGNPAPGAAAPSTQYVSRNYSINPTSSLVNTTFKVVVPPKKNAEASTSVEGDANPNTSSKDKETTSDPAEVVTLE